MVFQVFLPCYFGNELTELSNKLSTQIFHSNWILNNECYKTALKLFMENTKKPLKTEAIGMIAMNFATFTSICNSAYSLSAVFKNALENRAASQ